MSLPEGFILPSKFERTDNDLVMKPTTGSVGSQGVRIILHQTHDEQASVLTGKEMLKSEEVCLTYNDRFCTAASRWQDLPPKRKIELAPVYEAFKEQKEIHGTRIGEWSAISDSEKELMFRQNFFTVEQIASMDVNEFASFGLGTKDIWEKAQRHIRSKEENKRESETAEMLAVVEENKKLQARLAALEEKYLADQVEIANKEKASKGKK